MKNKHQNKSIFDKLQLLKNSLCRWTWNADYDAYHVTILYSKRDFREEIRSVEYWRYAWKFTAFWRYYNCIKYHRYYCTHIPYIYIFIYINIFIHYILINVINTILSYRSFWRYPRKQDTTSGGSGIRICDE